MSGLVVCVGPEGGHAGDESIHCVQIVNEKLVRIQVMEESTGAHNQLHMYCN